MSKKNRSGWTLVSPPQAKPGPSTPEGKAVSAQNARKHGLTAKEFIVRPDEQDAFEAFLAEHERDLQPEGALELDFFPGIVHAAWNLRRLRILEAESLANFDPADDKQAAVAALTKRTREVDPVSRRVELFIESMERACEIMNAKWTRRDMAEAQAA